MNTRQYYLSAIAAGTLALAASPLFAASSPSVGLSITASVTGKCIVSSTSAVAFGAYDPVTTNASTGADLDGTGSVGIKCTPGDGVSISLDSGANASGNQRRMQGPSSSAFMNYSLYTDSARTTAWGNGSNGASVQTITASTSSSERTFTVYGRVPKGQDVNVGSFSDTVQATVNF
jgi:spore coat protein U-like protein